MQYRTGKKTKDESTPRARVNFTIGNQKIDNCFTSLPTKLPTASGP
jgi:hypothetical protein